MGEFNDVWRDIEQLFKNGTEIRVLKQKKPKKILDITTFGIVITDEFGSTKELIRKEFIEETWGKLHTNGRLQTRDRPRNKDKRHFPFIMALFSHLDCIRIGKKNPITLYTKEYWEESKLRKSNSTKDKTIPQKECESGNFAIQSLQDVKKDSLISGGAIVNANIGSIIMDIEADEIENDLRTEGAVSFYYGKRYERDPLNRKRAIEKHGLSCVVCRFNYEEKYGERGKDFIEVHHTKPLSTFGGEEQPVNPETDLVPVCSNCHRMIHRRHDDVLTVDELREMLR